MVRCESISVVCRAMKNSGSTGPKHQPLGRFQAVISALFVLLLVGCNSSAATSDGADTAPDPPTTTSADMVPDPSSTTSVEPTVIDVATIWLDGTSLETLPMSGPAWDALRVAAHEDWDSIDLDDLTNNHDVQVLAGALVAARTGEEGMLLKVESALSEATGTQPSLVLPLARNLLSYVIAADLIGYRPPEFTSWLRQMLDVEADGRAGINSLRQSAMSDPSNHGTHARASVLAVALFVEDRALQETMADRFQDWLGRSGDDFVWKELDWQSNPSNPAAINPPGSQIDGLSVDGVLPEEQRRSGGFTTPPPQEGYVWEALQGAVATAEMLDRAGYPAWEWQDRALLRAFNWLYDVNDYPAKGDDEWQVWLVNRAYDTDFLTESPTRPGKNIGYTDWTHQN